jgi:hypothetical protein
MVLQSAVNRPAALDSMFILAASAASAVCHESGTAGDAKELLLSDSFAIAKFGVAGKRSMPPNRPTFYRALTAGENVHMAMIKISWKSCSAALPVRGSSNSSPHSIHFSKTPPQRRFARNRAESIATKTHSPSIRDQDFEMRYPGRRAGTKK